MEGAGDEGPPRQRISPSPPTVERGPGVRGRHTPLRAHAAHPHDRWEMAATFPPANPAKPPTLTRSTRVFFSRRVSESPAPGLIPFRAPSHRHVSLARCRRARERRDDSLRPSTDTLSSGETT